MCRHEGTPRTSLEEKKRGREILILSHHYQNASLAALVHFNNTRRGLILMISKWLRIFRAIRDQVSSHPWDIHPRVKRVPRWHLSLKHDFLYIKSSTHGVSIYTPHRFFGRSKIYAAPIDKHKFLYVYRYAMSRERLSRKHSNRTGTSI